MISTRQKNRASKGVAFANLDFGDRFNDYDRAGTEVDSRRSISMSQAPKLSMHKNKNAMFGLGKASILEKKSFMQSKIEVTQEQDEKEDEMDFGGEMVLEDYESDAGISVESFLYMS